MKIFLKRWLKNRKGQNLTMAMPLIAALVAMTLSACVSQPTGLVATEISGCQVDLNWEDQSILETDYIVERRVGSSGDFAVRATLQPDSVAFSDRGLAKNTDYTYRVRSVNGSFFSEYSGEATATTTLEDCYPLVATLYGVEDDLSDRADPQFYAQWDMIIDDGILEDIAGGSSISHLQAAANFLRARNPDIKILMRQPISYIRIGEWEPLMDPWGGDYGCNIFRDETGAPIPTFYESSYVINFTNSGTVLELLDFILDNYSTYGAIYDGIYFCASVFDADMYLCDWTQGCDVGDPSTWITSVDLDCDGSIGAEETRPYINEAWLYNMIYFMSTLRTDLGPEVVLLGNGAEVWTTYASQYFNGGVFEQELIFWMDLYGMEMLTWEEVQAISAYWVAQSAAPSAHLMMSGADMDLVESVGHAPWESAAPAQIEEAMTAYSRVRFGITSALMSGSHFAYDWGVTWHGSQWWYDEYSLPGNGYLGKPLSGPFPAATGDARVEFVRNGGFEVSGMTGVTVLDNGGFEEGFIDWITVDLTDEVTFVQDTIDFAPETCCRSLRIDIPTAGAPYEVQIKQENVDVTEGQEYTLQFWAKTSAGGSASLVLQNPEPPWDNYGLFQTIDLSTQWTRHQIVFEATATDPAAEFSIFVGENVGAVWIDEVEILEGSILQDWLQTDFTGLVTIDQICREDAPEGECSAEISMARPGSLWEVSLLQGGFELEEGVDYTLKIMVKGSTSSTIGVALRDATGFVNYGLWEERLVATEWETKIFPFRATGSTDDAILDIMVGNVDGRLLIDAISLHQGRTEVFRRDFDNGIAICNNSDQPHTVDLGGTFYRIAGTQDPLVNSGEPATSVDVGALDGIILLREPM